MTNTPSLNAVRSFVVAGRLRSFTAAAKELHVTQGAVSRMVQTLESDLGVQLFSRLGRSLELTDVGLEYFNKVEVALRRISAATVALKQNNNANTLPMIVNATFAIRWLVPHLPEFQKRNPSVRIEIIGTEANLVDRSQEAQAIISYGSPPWPGFVERRIPVGPLGIVASPLILDQSKIDEPADLMKVTLLRHAFDSHNHWQEFFDHWGVQYEQARYAPRFEQLGMIIEAATAGVGFALVPLFLIERELASNILTHVHSWILEAERGYYLLSRPGSNSDSRFETIERWLMARFSRRC